MALQNLHHESNSEAKGDRLPVARYQLASLTPSVSLVTPVAPLAPTTAALAPAETAAPVAETPAPLPESSAAIVAPRAATAPARQAEAPKPKPQPPKPSSMLDDSQIANIKTRLRLTADQEGYWPAVEAALRDVVKHQLSRRKDASQIDVNSPEVQRLTWAAMPLLMRMREDQKREVRQLARVIGLDAVASQI